ncbi:M1 family aminopeptidase [Actinopolymorpha sp. B17G11]|uniref:M1 family aminopeptidase n=1 Tax=Actinopolymorpha sp. B17G11 TaxID=3160861 RepID=UPI0032E46025
MSRTATTVRRLLAAGVLVAGVTACAPSAIGGLLDADQATPTPSGSASSDRLGPRASDPPLGTPAPTQAPGPQGPSACPTGGGGGGNSKVISAAGPARANRARDSTARARPWKDRPVVRLCFDVAKNRQVVRGTEAVTFTPDRRTCEVIFRAWPNKPETARSGNRLEVTAVAVNGRIVEPRVQPAGAPRGVPGTLIRVPVKGCVAAGRSVNVELAFTLTLGADGPERVGYSSEDGTAWLATAYPLLAWERGRGWATDPAVDLFGETVTSEQFQLETLDVVAPKGDDVLGTGELVDTMPAARAGSVVHRFTAEAVRDVTVTVGQLTLAEREVDGVRIHVGAPAEVKTRATPQEWADLTAAAVAELSGHLGPFPYDDLWVTIAPDIPTGIEFPGAIQFGNVNPRTYPQLVPHEVAHMWFYGLVGNNQARDPWLDEAFAEYAEVLANGTAGAETRFVVPPRVRNRVGETMRWYAALGQPDYYGAGVYRQGGAMLHEARRTVGSATFDRLLRNYIDANAHQIVTDDDVVRAFSSAPEVVKILREYGAISR